MEQNKDLPLELQENEEIEKEEIINYLSFLGKIMSKHEKAFSSIVSNDVTVYDIIISYSFAVKNFMSKVLPLQWWDKNFQAADETDIIESFADCTFHFLNVISTQNQEFFDNAIVGINQVVNDLMKQTYDKKDLIFSTLSGENAVSIPTQYAVCLYVLLKEVPDFTERDIELIFNFKLKNLK